MSGRGKWICVAMAALIPGAHARAELDLALFRAASCSALASEYAAVRDVNPAVLKEMRRTDKATSPAAADAGVAETTAPGGNQADGNAALAAYRQAIVTVAQEKKCALPGSGPGPAAAQ